jgi:hypothetical protein
MEQQKNPCCAVGKERKSRGVWSGIMLGVLPHSFCIAFALFSIIGAVTVSAFLKKFMLIPNFFLFLVVVSLVLATVSCVVYLRKSGCLCISGLRSKWRYVATVYLGTILVNSLMFFVVFPVLANSSFQKVAVENSGIQNQGSNLSELTLRVQIPCSGHAPLIIDEIKKNCDVQSVKFSMPNVFHVEYDSDKMTPEKLASLEIFETYKATIN